MEEGKDYSGGYVFNIEYNHVHDWGAGIVSDFGAIYIGSSYNCDGASLAELEQHCYTHAHIFNNWVAIKDTGAYPAGKFAELGHESF